jgi:hypothetical protein
VTSGVIGRPRYSRRPLAVFCVRWRFGCLEYERVDPVPMGSDPATISYWQLPSGAPVTRARLQTFLQMHMKAQGAPGKYYKSPNMAELYAPLTTQRLDPAFSCLGVMSSLDVVSEESRFWTAYTTRPG